jgi:hypothetical protein
MRTFSFLPASTMEVCGFYYIESTYLKEDETIPVVSNVLKLDQIRIGNGTVQAGFK